MGRASRRDERATRAFVEQMALVLADWGMPRMAGRVLFVLMSAEEQALTAAELAQRLAVSPASISGAVRYLIQINMVARDPVPGSRRDRYRLVEDSWYEVTLAKMTLFKTLADLAGQGIEAVGGEQTPAGTRLAGMRDFYTFIQEAMPDLIGEWAERKVMRRGGVA